MTVNWESYGPFKSAVPIFASMNLRKTTKKSQPVAIFVPTLQSSCFFGYSMMYPQLRLYESVSKSSRTEL
jgi:hypothetical protein